MYLPGREAGRPTEARNKSVGPPESREFAASQPCESARSRVSKGVGAPLRGGLRWGTEAKNTFFGRSACGGGGLIGMRRISPRRTTKHLVRPPEAHAVAAV